MLKDTKSSGYNKAPACESRGFGHKKEGENFDTPSCHKYNTYIFIALLFFNPICKMYDEKMGGMGRLPRNLPST